MAWHPQAARTGLVDGVMPMQTTTVTLVHDVRDAIRAPQIADAYQLLNQARTEDLAEIVRTIGLGLSRPDLLRTLNHVLARHGATLPNRAPRSPRTVQRRNLPTLTIHQSPAR